MQAIPSPWAGLRLPTMHPDQATALLRDRVLFQQVHDQAVIFDAGFIDRIVHFHHGVDSSISQIDLEMNDPVAHVPLDGLKTSERFPGETILREWWAFSQARIG
jgi:hypothetical protein